VDVHTPINVFRRDDEYIFVLTYGSDADWGKNVLAADGCWIRTRGHDVRLTQPEVIVDPTRRLVPAPIRFIERFGTSPSSFGCDPVQDRDRRVPGALCGEYTCIKASPPIRAVAS